MLPVEVHAAAVRGLLVAFVVCFFDVFVHTLYVQHIIKLIVFDTRYKWHMAHMCQRMP